MPNITLYSNNCPKCRVLESKLNSKNIKYIKNTDIEEMKKLGFISSPILSVDGKTLDFINAVNWVNSQKEVMA